MEILQSIMGFFTVQDNLEKLFSVLFGVMAVAQLIVNMTHTPKDDAVVGKIYSVIEKLAGIWSIKAKMLPGESLVEKVQPSAAPVVEAPKA